MSDLVAVADRRCNNNDCRVQTYTAVMNPISLATCPVCLTLGVIV